MSLNDGELNFLSVIKVECFKGKYYVLVFVFLLDYKIFFKLKKVEGLIR